MPISPDNRKLYPPNWRQISREVRSAAGHRCQGTSHYPGCDATQGARHPDTGSPVVITVAHLDHNPANCERENLRALCQRCHFDYDKEDNARKRARTRASRRLTITPSGSRRMKLKKGGDTHAVDVS